MKTSNAFHHISLVKAYKQNYHIFCHVKIFSTDFTISIWTTPTERLTLHTKWCPMHSSLQTLQCIMGILYLLYLLNLRYCIRILWALWIDSTWLLETTKTWQNSQSQHIGCTVKFLLNWNDPVLTRHFFFHPGLSALPTEGKWLWKAVTFFRNEVRLIPSP